MDLAAIITATAGALVPIGSAIGFIWRNVEKRFEKIETELARCEDRERQAQVRERQGQERRATQLTVIELLWREVERLGPPAAGVLARAKHLLAELKQPPPSLDDDE